MNRRFLPSIPLFFLCVILFSPVYSVYAILPEFQSYDIGNTTPFIDESTEVTVFLNFILPIEGDISAMVGTLAVQLFWSRDKESWVGESMALMSGNNVYRATIPRQDGLGNYYYDQGAGPCYWYIKIDNVEEESSLFSVVNPNSEIYFMSIAQTSAEEETEIEEVDTLTDDPVAQFVEDIDEVLITIFGESIIRDPVFQAIVLLMFGVIIALIIAGSRLNPILVKAFGSFFTKIRRK